MADKAGRPANLISVVVPVYNEAGNILPLLEVLRQDVAEDHETLIVYDFAEDTTLPPAREFRRRYRQLRLVRNDLGPGVLNAIKKGMSAAKGDVVVVTMADLSDDTSQIRTLAHLVRQGAGVVAASRYMRGGSQVGGPPLKRALSRLAGLSLHWLTSIGTHDATNNYKAYSRDLLDEIEVESTFGFELGLELTTKAHLNGHLIAEIPTTWRDRTAGESRFRVVKWLPGYLRWYFRCLLGSWSGRARRARQERMEGVRSSPPRPAELSRG